MWTIIEDNTAIICACLPMCKRALSAVFPCLAFEHRREWSNKLSYPSSRSRSRSRWTQFFDGPPSKDQSALVLDPRQVSTHSQVQTGFYPSEEFIMSPVSPVHDSSKRIESSGSEEGRAIRKVTRYEVAYDDAPMPRTK